MKRSALGILGFAALVLAGVSHPTVTLRAQDAAVEAAEAAPAPLADTDLIVSINGKPLTVEQLRFLALTRRSPFVDRFTASNVPSLRGEELLDLARAVGVYDVLAQEARENGMELNDEDKARADQQLSQLMEGIVFRRVVTDKLEPATEAELDAAYEERKEKEFKRLEELRMRHIFVSTYEEYRVKEGDSLESIAEAIAGDKEAAARILADETKKPRIEMLEAPADDPDAKSDKPLPPRALTEGELLLVPSAAKIASARAKAEEAIKRLQGGESFEAVAAEVSENENPGRLWIIRPETQERGMMEELSTAFMELEDGGFSEPIQTKHGFQIVKRESYQPKSYVTRDEAAARLRGIVDGAKRQALIDAFFEDYGSNPAVVKLNDEAILARGDDAKPEDVLATIGEKEYVRKDIMEGRTAPKETDLESVDAFRTWLLAQRPAKQEIVEAYKKVSKLDQEPSVQAARELALNTALGTRRLNALLDEKAASVDEAASRAYYEENISYYRQSAAFDLVAVNIALDASLEPDDAKAKAKALLEEKIAPIQTAGDFRTLAEDLKASDIATARSGPLGLLSPDNLAESDREAIKAAKIPGKTAVIVGDSVATAYWVESKREEHTEPFESVEDAITEILQKRARTDADTEIHAAAKERVEVEALAK